MIKVRVEVRNEIGSFTVAVRAENLRRAMLIARNLCPGSDIGIAFPIDPDDYFEAGHHHDERVDLEVLERYEKREESLVSRLPGPSSVHCSGASLETAFSLRRRRVPQEASGADGWLGDDAATAKTAS
jgi:hypothetical protein